MKYQKPLVQDFSQLSFAEGACVSGAAVGNCINGGLAGTCSSTGYTAGICSTNGNTINPVACAATGINGTGAPNCNPHGMFAQI